MTVNPTLLVAVTITISLVVGAEVGARDDGWMRFRGPNGGGIADGEGLPTKFGADENLLWKTPLPGGGSSSPVVAEGKVFVTCYTGYGLDKEQPGEMGDLGLHLLCLDQVSGEILWKRSVRPKLPEVPFKSYMVNHGYASFTPACDGDSVYAFFGRSGAVAYSLDGDLKWKADLGDETHEFGSAASPILYGDLVIFNASVESGSLVALNKQSGEVVWRAEDTPASWSTPVILSPATGKPELILNVARKVLAFDPSTGERLWWCDYRGDVAFGSAIVVGDMVYVSGGNSGRGTAAFRGGGRGDVTETHLQWQINRATKVPTLLADGDLLHAIGDSGIAICLRRETGEEVYRERLPRGWPWASPVLADGKIYVAAKGGVVVLRAGPAYEVLAENMLPDTSRFHATPAVDGNRLLVRSEAFLYCFGTSDPQ